MQDETKALPVEIPLPHLTLKNQQKPPPSLVIRAFALPLILLTLECFSRSITRVLHFSFIAAVAWDIILCMCLLTACAYSTVKLIKHAR